jgi:hypothetical protein
VHKSSGKLFSTNSRSGEACLIVKSIIAHFASRILSRSVGGPSGWSLHIILQSTLEQSVGCQC